MTQRLCLSHRSLRAGGLAAALLALIGTIHAQPKQPTPPQPKVVFKGHTEPVYAAAFSPDGKFAATGSFDKTIRLWDPATGKEVRSLAGKNGHQGQVLSVAFSPDGEQLASGGSDNFARVWDVSPTGPPARAAAAGVAGAAGHQTAAADPPAKALQHPNLVDAVAFDKTGTLLATACHDGILRVWDVTKGAATKTINAHTMPTPAPIYAVAWTPDAKQLVTASYDRSVKVWDAASGNLVREIKPGPDKLPDVAAGKAPPPPEPGHRDQVFAIAFTKDTKFLATGSSDRTAQLWDFASGKSVKMLANPGLKAPITGLPVPSHPGFIHAVRFTPDGTRLITAGTAPRGAGYLAVWNVADGTLVAGYEVPYGPIYAADLSTDGTMLLLACGPKDRTHPEGDAVVLPVPGK